MYMTVRYEGNNGEPDLELVDYVNSSPNGEPYHGKASTLLEWHNQDPVDSWEIERNNKVYSYQENRNPFIDHPEYAALIWPELANDSMPQIALSLNCYPNPFNPETTISFSSEKDTNVKLTVYNIAGQKITELFNDTIDSKTKITWSGTDAGGNNVASGIYFIKLQTPENTVTQKILLLK
jgi:arginine utilization protein RocB